MLVDVMQRLRPMRGLPWWCHYAGAVALVLAAYAARLALDGIYHHPFLTFIAAMLIASLLLDHGAGLVATLLGAALAPRFFVEPGSGFGLGGTDAAMALGAFVGFGLFVAGTIEALRATADRLREANRQLALANRRLELAERSARAAAERRGVLLADINHRLKNSLQAVGGILDVEGRRTGDTVARTALEDAAGRLRVLARVHERLHLGGGEGSATAVSTRDFLDALCADLRATLLGAAPVSLHAHVEDIGLDAARAVPVGLITNEAVTNALKHAFPGGRRGAVSVRLGRCGEGWLRLEVADDGIGPATEGAGRAAMGGTRLIRTLSRQLGGAAEWHGPPGTTVVVRFPEALPPT